MSCTISRGASASATEEDTGTLLTEGGAGTDWASTCELGELGGSALRIGVPGNTSTPAASISGSERDSAEMGLPVCLSGESAVTGEGAADGSSAEAADV